MQEIRFNINHEIKIKLTKTGAVVYNSHIREQNQNDIAVALVRHLGFARQANEVTEGDTIEEQLWEIFKIFGSSMNMWTEPFFEKNEIIFMVMDSKEIVMWDRAIEIRDDLKELENWSGNWPPSQGDLQSIIFNETGDSTFEMFLDLATWLNGTLLDTDRADYVCRYFRDGSEVWLAYIMAIYHAKFWNGARWVSPENS